MSPQVLAALRARSEQVMARWEELLRSVPASGPLANPDTLMHLIPESLEELYAQLAPRPARVHLTLAVAEAQKLPACECCNNPYLPFYVAGEHAIAEHVRHIQSRLPPLLRKESDLAEAIRAVRRMGRAEIDAFCGACAQRGIAPRCRHALAGR